MSSKSKDLFDRRRRRVRHRIARTAQAAGRGCRCSARRSTSMRRSSTTRRPRRWPRPRRSTRSCASSSRPAPTRTAAAAVGKLVAERAKAAGVTEVVFDRGGYLFHGRVKALADAAREGGLEF